MIPRTKGTSETLRVAFKVATELTMGEVLEDIEKANRRNLYKAAGLVRMIAKRSIKRAPRYKKLPSATGEKWERGPDGKFKKGRYEKLGKRAASKPGNPPLTHGDPGPLKAMMWFDLDEGNQTAVIGPALFKGAKAPDVPHLLEFGGVSINTNGQRYKLEPRPYMRPAELAARGKYPQFWKDSI